MEKQPLPKEPLFSQNGYTFEYDPAAGQVTLETTDYHSGKMVLTEEMIKRINAKVQTSRYQTEPRPVQAEKKISLRKASDVWKSYALFTACILIICLIVKQVAGRKH
jgi:hypothetical protein